ncbi:DUF6520 family protein [Chryseobacterium sp.]|uniref:DUF6520 family protein n=1 Tax=Chryseobacterium sp. TaxID=1871047 RepID=UPI0028A1A9A6|nr:DUF6520 family protein [Chryseobacterium sp.]
MKNLFFSALVVLLGTGAAFATNNANKSKSAIVEGHYYDNNLNRCESAQVDCSTIDFGDMCEWSVGEETIVLREEGVTTCGAQLFKVPQP